MLETRAVIVQIEGQYAFVQASQASGCEQCNGKGCGAGKLSQLFCSKPRQFQVDNSINADVGDEVIVSVAEGSVLRGISVVYLLPMLLLVLGAALPDLLSPNGFQRAGPGTIPGPILRDNGAENRSQGLRPGGILDLTGHGITAC